MANLPVLTVQFVNSVHEEIAGNQQLVDQMNNRSNHGPSYKMFDDNTTQVLAESRFLLRSLDHMQRVIDAPGVNVSQKATALATILVQSIRFGMYLQRKISDRDGLII